MLHHRLGQLRAGIQDAAKQLLPGFFNTRVGVIQAIKVLDRDRACDISSGMTTHTVGHHIEMAAHRTGILISGSHLPNVGRRGAQDAGRCHKPHRRSSKELVPIVTGVFNGTGVGILTRLPSTNVPLVESRS